MQECTVNEADAERFAGMQCASMCASSCVHSWQLPADLDVRDEALELAANVGLRLARQPQHMITQEARGLQLHIRFPECDVHDSRFRRVVQRSTPADRAIPCNNTAHHPGSWPPP